VDADGALATLDVVARVDAQGPYSRVFLKPGARPRDLMEQLQRRGVPMEHFEVVRAPLEEIFVRTVQANERGAA
jgi:hypothetical protein